MEEQVIFGLSANQVMAWSSVLSSALVLVLIAINFYYAWHAKRQADASIRQADASNRQAEIAQRTLNILLEQQQQQRKIDEANVRFQLEAAILTVDNWRDRLSTPGFPQLPSNSVEVRPVNFVGAIRSAERIDPIVAGYMEAALNFMTVAETNINVLRGISSNHPYWKNERDKAAYALNVARFKLDEARTRLEGVQDSGEKTNAATG